MCPGLKGRSAPMYPCRDLKDGTATSDILDAIDTHATPISGKRTSSSFPVWAPRNLSRMFTASKNVESVKRSFWHRSAMQVRTFFLWVKVSHPCDPIFVASGMNSPCLACIALSASLQSCGETLAKPALSRGEPEKWPRSSPWPRWCLGLSSMSMFSRLVEFSEQHKMLLGWVVGNISLLSPVVISTVAVVGRREDNGDDDDVVLSTGERKVLSFLSTAISVPTLSLSHARLATSIWCVT
mmetsp:Transcript_1624/g.5115  ORF Transcript_1624/g.5115 Transcript_1624/m.5115 type:complete len:240 (-) Transcript_1624:439-1158(-)